MHTYITCIIIGVGVLTMTYKAKTYTADFNPDGTIKHNNEIYSSPSALSIYLKRLDMPNEKLPFCLGLVAIAFLEEYMRLEVEASLINKCTV